MAFAKFGQWSQRAQSNFFAQSYTSNMLNVVLVHPEIPPNTGNIIRLCANTGVMLHLIEPLGFPIDHAKMRRAGLDYHEFTSLNLYADWQDFLTKIQPKRLWALTTKGTSSPFNISFADGDYFVFGSETAGLPPAIRESFPKEHLLRLPMRPDNRSLNLSNSVAIVVYEAWRQLGFDGAS
jgi:tRNA (cytidine/uridine-2'-O-)-methyltransferase